MKRTHSILAGIALAMAALIRPLHIACLIGHRSRRVVVAFNEAADADTPQAGELRAMNAFGFGQDWQMFCPFGDHPVEAYDPKDTSKKVEIIQRVSPKSADTMIAAFNSIGGKLARLFVGIPIYDRHPDAPGATGDKRKHGAIADISKSDTGILLAANYAKSGRDLIESGQRTQHSEHWALMPLNETKDGKPVYEPVALISVGLVAKGNIPLAALNEAKMVKCPHCEKEFDYAAQPETSAGVVACPECNQPVQQDGTAPTPPATESPDAKLAAANEAVTAKQLALNAAARQIVETTGALHAANEQIATLKSQIGNSAAEVTAAKSATGEATKQLNAANGEIATLKTQIADSRKAHAAVVVNRAIVEGRLFPADKDKTVGELCAANCAPEAVAKVATARPVIKIDSVTGRLGERKPSNESEARVLQAANEHHAKNGGNFVETLIRMKKDAGLA